jgi:hypothetical protein
MAFSLGSTYTIHSRLAPSFPTSGKGGRANSMAFEIRAIALAGQSVKYRLASRCIRQGESLAKIVQSLNMSRGALAAERAIASARRLHPVVRDCHVTSSHV